MLAVDLCEVGGESSRRGNSNIFGGVSRTVFRRVLLCKQHYYNDTLFIAPHRLRETLKRAICLLTTTLQTTPQTTPRILNSKVGSYLTSTITISQTSWPTI